MRRVPPLLLLSIVMLPVAHAAQPERDGDFAGILQMEDQRTTGAGALAAYLAPPHPLATRVRAALAFGRIGSPVTNPYDLLSILNDPAPELRRMAAFALGEMDDIKAAPLVATMLGDADPEVRALAAEALGKLKDPGSLPTLVRSLADADPAVIGMSLRALWKIEPGPNLNDLSARAAGVYLGSSGDLRRDAAYCLLRMQMAHTDEAGIEAPLMFISTDADPLTRSYAARGLGLLKSGASTQTLLRLAADTDWRVRVNAFNGLRARPVEAMSGETARRPIYESALTDDEPGVALSALGALESFASSWAHDHLVTTLAHPKTRLVEVAILALASREKGAALALLKPLASNPQWSIRARVAEALGTISTPEVEPDLARLAADTDPRVRSVAIDSLGKLKSPGAAGLVTAALKDDDPYVRATAIDAAGAAAAPGRDELIALLAGAYSRALTDQPNDARLGALGLMGKIGTPAARTEIEKGLKDSDFLVRRRAAEILRDTFKQAWPAALDLPASRTPAEYLEVVRRGRRQVTATLQTEAGSIVINLFPDDAPLTVDNYIRLARAGSLDGLSFHRVVPNFVIQDGDPRGDGNGGPPWQIRCEINPRRYGEGAVGMALSGKDTGGSQYFITHSPQPHLDGGYTIFGQVVSGQESVRRMVQGDRIVRVSIEETTP